MRDFTERQATENEETARHDDTENCLCLECAGASRLTIHEQIEQHISENGYTVVSVMDNDPPFCYTVGLSATLKQPEFLICGRLQLELMYSLLENAVGRLRAKPSAFASWEVRKVLRLKQGDSFVAGRIGCREIVDDTEMPLNMAKTHYGTAYRGARQLVIPDPAGKLPWEPGCSADWIETSKQTPLYAPDENGV